MTLQRLALCAKSPWNPAIRREHACAVQAVAHGIDTTFVEAPVDVRALKKGSARSWMRGLTGDSEPELGGLHVVARSTVAPGHRARTAAVFDTQLLARVLRQRGPFTSIVVNVPWQWDAVRGAGGGRVFDAADDWTALIPSRQRALLECYRRIGDEADAVIVANPALSALFGGRETQFVPNATQSAMLLGAPTPPPGARRLLYVGTLSERFDAVLASKIMSALPNWTLDLYGECRYPGARNGPGPSLQRLLTTHAGQVCWKGVVERANLPFVIDAADVLIAPNCAHQSAGQSSMKAFDGAARGRPMVATSRTIQSDGKSPPHLFEAVTAAEFVDAIRTCAAEPPEYAKDRVRWAAGQTWEARWPAWAAAARLRPEVVPPEDAEGQSTSALLAFGRAAGPVS